MADRKEVIIALHLDPEDPKQKEFIDLMGKASRKKSVLAGIIAHQFLGCYNLTDDRYNNEDIKNFISLYSTIEKLGLLNMIGSAGISNPNPAPLPITSIIQRNSSDDESKPSRCKERKKESVRAENNSPSKEEETRFVYKENTPSPITMNEDNSCSDEEMQVALNALAAFSR